MHARSAFEEARIYIQYFQACTNDLFHNFFNTRLLGFLLAKGQELILKSNNQQKNFTSPLLKKF